MRKFLMAFGMVIGAAVMYLLDPNMGRRRRAMLRDQVASKTNKAGDQLGSQARHMQNKAKGVVAEAKSAVEDQKERMTETTGKKTAR